MKAAVFITAAQHARRVTPRLYIQRLALPVTRAIIPVMEEAKAEAGIKFPSRNQARVEEGRGLFIQIRIALFSYRDLDRLMIILNVHNGWDEECDGCHENTHRPAEDIPETDSKMI